MDKGIIPMQDTLRLIIFTIIGVIGIWFITMTVDVHIFLHSDIDPLVSGNIPLNRTDISDQCGADNQNSAELIDYKLNTANQIVYLCPLGIWPIRSTVVAATISDNFRRTLSASQLAKVNAAYPPQSEQLVNPAAAPNQPPPANTGMSNTAPTEAMPPANQQPAANGNANTANPAASAPSSNSMMTPPPVTNPPAPANDGTTAVLPTYAAPPSNSMMAPPPVTNPPAPANAAPAQQPAMSEAPAPQNP
jgi:hypothetical protein